MFLIWKARLWLYFCWFILRGKNFEFVRSVEMQQLSMTTVLWCCFISKSILTKIFYLSLTSWHFSWLRSLCRWVLIGVGDLVWSCPRYEGTDDVQPQPGLSAARKRSCEPSCRSCCHWCSHWYLQPGISAAGSGWTWLSPGPRHWGNLLYLLQGGNIRDLSLLAVLFILTSSATSACHSKA